LIAITCQWFSDRQQRFSNHDRTSSKTYWQHWRRCAFIALLAAARQSTTVVFFRWRPCVKYVTRRRWIDESSLQSERPDRRRRGLDNRRDTPSSTSCTRQFVKRVRPANTVRRRYVVRLSRTNPVAVVFSIRGRAARAKSPSADVALSRQLVAHGFTRFSRSNRSNPASCARVTINEQQRYETTRGRPAWKNPNRTRARARLLPRLFSWLCTGDYVASSLWTRDKRFMRGVYVLSRRARRNTSVQGWAS